jgi:hypothetical protein
MPIILVDIRVPLNLVYAHFLFVDVVGLLDAYSVVEQINKIKKLNNLIESCEVFKNVEPNLKIVLPAGDGICIGFLQGPELPLMLAIEVHEKLREYNKSTEDPLKIRIGMNDGPVYVVKDVMGKSNIWGPGIIIARRVMDVGDEGHILLSQRMAETLRELSDEYKVLIKPLHDYSFKHGVTMLLYSIYGDGIGNPNTPTKNLSQRSKAAEALRDLRLYAVYDHIVVSLEIKDPSSMLVHHKRVYHIKSVSNEPIETVWHGIAADVPKSFSDLNVVVTDESGRECKIASINFDKPYQKEFTTSFNKPVFKGEKGRSYTLEYDVEEPKRYFENYFAINCKKYTMSLLYPKDADIKPIVYEMNVDKNTKKWTAQPKISELDERFKKASWTKTDIIEGQAFGFEW